MTTLENLASQASFESSQTGPERETAMQRGDPYVSLHRVLEEGFAPRSRLTTALQYCQGSTEMAIQVDAGREPYLLLEDGLQPGNYTLVEIYDNRIAYLDRPTERCWLDLKNGEVLVASGAAVYWR